MQSPSFLTNPLLSFICFGGKGGVGKTTSATATALFLASENPGKKVLLASIDPAHSLADCLQDTCNLPNLAFWEIDAQASFRKFIARYNATLKKIIDRGSFLDKEDISTLLSISLPGIDEFMGMIELAEMVEGNAYDIIVLDTAPTGHTIKFLQIPHLFRKWIHVLNLMMQKHRYLSQLYRRRYQPDDADEFIEVFTRGAKKIDHILKGTSCEFVPVMLPEALSVRETSRFLTILQKHKITVNNIIINRVYPESDCSFCTQQYSIQKKYIDEMQSDLHEYNYVLMPLYRNEVQGRDSLLKFAAEMAENTPLVRKRDNHNEVVTARCTGESEKWVMGDSKGHPLFVSPPSPFTHGKEEGLHIPELQNHLPVPGPATRFLLFGGKGGVGKTTLASATALSLSDIYPEKRIVLFSTDPAHSLSDCLDSGVGDKGLFLKKNLFVQEMEAEKEYQTLKHLYAEEIKDLLSSFIKKDSSVSIAFEKEIMESFIDTIPPGIDEVMAISKIIDYVDKESFDIFVLDTAPTGHLIRFLEMPELALEWLKFFFNLFLKYKQSFRMPKMSAFLVDLSKKIKKLLTMLRDRERSLFIPIAIPTDMACEETKDLVEAIRRMKIPIQYGILNMVHPAQRENNALIECPLCTNRVAYEKTMHGIFRTLFSPESLYVIQKQEKEIVGIGALQRLGAELYAVEQPNAASFMKESNGTDDLEQTLQPVL